MNKFICLLSILVMTLSVGCKSVNKQAGDDDRSVIKIGLVFPVTGNQSVSTTDALNAAKMAIKEIQEDPNAKYRYEAIVEDNMSELKRTAFSANKLIAVDKVDAIISVMSAHGSVISPLAERAKTIHFGIGSDKSTFKGLYNFLCYLEPKKQAYGLIKGIKDQNFTRVALVFQNQAGVLSFVDEIKKSIRDNDIEVVVDESFNPGEVQFQSIISKILHRSPEIVIMQSFPPELGIFYKQLRRVSNIPFTSNWIAVSGSDTYMFEGCNFVTANWPIPEDLRAKYVDVFKKEPGNVWVSEFYIMTELLISAYENTPLREGHSKPVNEDVVNTFLAIKNLYSSVGTVSVEEDGIIQPPLTINTVKDGKIVVLETVK